MSSQRKIEANRRNSQKSTGPRSDAGKAVSSLNHTTSGIFAESQLLVSEDQAELKALAVEFYTDFLPENATQRGLVDTAIHNEWLLRRLRRADTGVCDHYIDDHEDRTPEITLGRAYICYDKTLTRIQQRLNWAQRNFERAVKELNRLRALRPVASQPAPQPEPLPEPKPVASAVIPVPDASIPEIAGPAPQKPAIGFIPNVVAAVTPAPAAPRTPAPDRFGFDSSTVRIQASCLTPVTMETPCPLPVISMRSPESAETCSLAR